jgi:hypothetical protein
MNRREALIIESGGERFRFYYDTVVTETLHITRRHGTTVEEAVTVFFDGQTSWNDELRRFETFTETFGLYWARHPTDQSVIVISCFPLGDE